MKTRKVIGVDGALYGWRIDCPGCGGPHVFHAKMADCSPGWTFNGDDGRPTFAPSLLLTWDEGPERVQRRCHSIVTDGRIAFCTDSTHALSGQTVDLPELQADDEARRG